MKIHPIPTTSSLHGFNMIDTTIMQQTDSITYSSDRNSDSSTEMADTLTKSIHVRVHSTEEELAAIETVWKRHCTHPHADPDFFRTVVRTSPGVKSAYVLSVERDGEITALLLGRVEESHLDVHLGYARLPQPKVRTLVFIYGGLLGSPSQDECNALADSISDALKSGIADVTFFNHLHTESPLYSSLLKSSGFFTRDRFLTLAAHRKITIPSSTEELWKQFKYKARGNFRWNVKTFLKTYADHYTIECITHSSQLEELMRKVEAIASKTYQRSLGVGFGTSAAELERLRLKAEKGWLQAYILSIDGTPAAFLCGTVYNGVFHADSMGFDPQYRRTSPGIFLTLNVIEKFCELGDEERIIAMDWGLGDARYKSDLCNIDWEDCSLHIFAPTLRGAILNAYRTPVLAIDHWARRVFNASVQEKIKGKWRALRTNKSMKSQSAKQ